MMGEHQHTPTPWTCHNFKVLSPDERRDLTEPTVAYCGDYRIAVAGVRGYDLHHADEADAAFIVRACNAHDDLVAALKRARQDTQFIAGTAGPGIVRTEARKRLDEIDAALRLAEAQP